MLLNKLISGEVEMTGMETELPNNSLPTWTSISMLTHPDIIWRRRWSGPLPLATDPLLFVFFLIIFNI